MALRGQATQANTTTNASVTVTHGISIQSGDIIILTVNGGGGNNNTFTWPSGFGAITGLTNIGLAASGGSTCGINYKVAGGSEPSTYTVSSSVTDFLTLHIRVYSGRNSSSPFTATAQTGLTAWGTLALNGLTAAGRDDVVFIAQYDNNGSGYGTFTPPTGFGNGLLIGGVVTFSPAAGVCDFVNNSGGATGTLTFSQGASSLPANYGGYVVSLAVAQSAWPTPSSPPGRIGPRQTFPRQAWNIPPPPPPPQSWPGPSAPGCRGPIYTFPPQARTFTDTSVGENITGQTIASSKGTILPEVDYSLTGQTITSTEGTVTYTVSYGLTGQTATFTEGTISYQVSYSLTQQTATFSEGTIPPEVDYFPTQQIGTFAEGTITPSIGGDVTLSLSGESAAFIEGLITISGQDVGISQAGGSGKRRRIKRASEVFQEEMAKLERQATEATEQRVSIEEKIEQSKYDPVPEDIQRYVASFERALRRAEAYERSQNIEVPVLFRLPKKSAGVERVEAFKRLQSLARIARHREEVAKERLRKVRERIDEEAAIYLMNFIMWDD